MEIKTRQAIEKQIVQSAITAILAAGYSISVDDGEDRPIKKSIDASAILDAMFSVDEEFLIAHNAEGKRVGTVYLVYGNDGYDVISDYSLSLDSILEQTGVLANSLAPR